MKRFAVIVAASLATAAAAQEGAPQPGRYMPLFPGMYAEAHYAHDERDSSFDQQGNEVDSAVPTVGGHTALPESRADLAFTWHFPLFETYGLPFLSSRTHLARVSLHYVENETTGALAAFNASERGQDKDTDEADDLRDTGRGIGDMQLEFGSYLYGSPAPEWRTRERAPFAVLLLVGMNVPYGVYDRDSAVNAGTNTGAFHGKLGVHWQPWQGGFVDAGYGYRAYLKNQDAAYGFLAPTSQGDDQFWDVSLGQRVLPGLYVAGFASGRQGDENKYLNPRFAPNAPPPNETIPLIGADNYPTPGEYHDDGTKLVSAGASIQYFLTQRWLIGLHYVTPLSGQSGQFVLPFTDRQPAGCTPGALTCMTSEGDSVLVDGQGPARVFASDSWMLSIAFNFGQGDTFVCTGCEKP